MKQTHEDPELWRRLKRFVDQEVILNVSTFVEMIDLEDEEELFYELHPKEVLEHWVVSSMLGQKLRNLGEVVVDVGWHNVWCRTCSGQAIALDSCIDQAFRELILGDDVEHDPEGDWDD